TGRATSHLGQGQIKWFQRKTEYIEAGSAAHRKITCRGRQFIHVSRKRTFEATATNNKINSLEVAAILQVFAIYEQDGSE
ncbi:hypothetical protein, partial [Cribrihabitans marinus]|uniref:hypothetical protein n=1 Tax=Cribrihabitans marinus TaxID=1227549 RepID=UPI001E569A23